MLRIRALGAAVLVCLALFAFSDRAHAQAAVQGTINGGDENQAFQWFPTKPATVAVDVWVLDKDGATIAGPFSASAVDVFANDEVYRVGITDLLVPGSVGELTPECLEQTIVLRWKPAGVTCSSSPSGCPFTFSKVGGEACKVDLKDSTDSYTFATSVVAAQGIDAAVMAYYGNRGQLPIRWRQKDQQFFNRAVGSPPILVWEVYKYRSTPAPAHLSCVVETTVNPATVLPSFAGCTGN